MALDTAILAEIFSLLDIEDRVKCERVSKVSKVAVDDSWRNKTSLVREDHESDWETGWICVPGSKRCEILSKMTSLKTVDIAYAVMGASEYYYQIVDTIVENCPVVRRIYNDHALNLVLKYCRRHKSEAKVDLITCDRARLATLREIKQYVPDVKVRWEYDGGSFPCLVTHVVGSCKLKMDVFGDLNPDILTSLQSINLTSQMIWLDQLDHICSNFPKLKSLKILVGEPTLRVVQCLRKLESLEHLEVRNPKGVDGSIIGYLKTTEASNLNSVTLDSARFFIERFVDILPEHLPKLNYAKITNFRQLKLGYSYKHKSIEIDWSDDYLQPIFDAFPKVTDFTIKCSVVSPQWTVQLKQFALRRPHKCFEVYLDPKQKSGVEYIEKTDNIIIELI